MPRSGVEGISGECKAIMQEHSFAEDALEFERPDCSPIPGMVYVGLIS